MKKSCFRESLILLICLALVFFALGCGSKNNLVGLWESDNGESVEFFKDGNVMISNRFVSASGSYSIVEKNRVRLELDGIFGLSGAQLINYEIKGNQLTLEGITYTRR